MESNNEVKHDIFFDLPEEYPKAEVTGELKKTWDAPTITIVAIESSTLLVEIIGLIKSFVDSHGYKEKERNKIRLTDKKKGKEVIISTDKNIDPSEIIANFLSINSRKKK